MHSTKYTREVLERVVKSSRPLAEVMRKLGLPPTAKPPPSLPEMPLANGDVQQPPSFAVRAIRLVVSERGVMAAAAALGAVDRKVVWVRVPPLALLNYEAFRTFRSRA